MTTIIKTSLIILTLVWLENITVKILTLKCNKKFFEKIGSFFQQVPVGHVTIF